MDLWFCETIPGYNEKESCDSLEQITCLLCYTTWKNAEEWWYKILSDDLRDMHDRLSLNPSPRAMKMHFHCASISEYYYFMGGDTTQKCDDSEYLGLEDLEF